MDYFIGGENMSTITEYNCPNCNAGLEFNPETQKWKCNYCFSEFNEDEVDLKGYMYCDDEDFKDFFKRILSQIGKFDEANDRNFIKELFDDVKEGVE
jgi:DNA-directed RNA polymerase subunit RPC12/RpoP